MNLPKGQRTLVIAFLSITMAALGAVSTEPTANQNASPFWQFVLREFVFKTISSRRYWDDDLHKKLQEAPFFGGPLAEVSDDPNAVLSRGNVYNMPDEQWILCQEGCTKCELCNNQKNDPAVKWTLRREKRLTSSGLPKWNLRLTVVPQPSEIARINKHHQMYNNMHAINQDKDEKESAQDAVSSSTQPEYTFEKVQQPNGAQIYSAGDWPNEDASDDYRSGSTRTRNYLANGLPSFTYHDSDQSVIKERGLVAGAQDEVIPRLIVGIDQYGKKHLVHLVSIDSPFGEADEPNNYASNYWPSYKLDNAARISRTTRNGRSAEPSYEKLVDRILDSFDTHRNFIEKFLYADRIESGNEHESARPFYSTYPEDDRLGKKNVESYRVEDSRRPSKYPSGVAYQVDEPGEQFRRYTDTKQEVNKPYGEYQDQNTMIEYEPYGASTQGQQQRRWQHQGERSLPQADVKRKRRNSFTKLMDSTVGHQTSTGNHTQSHTFDTKFSKWYSLENSTDPSHADSPLKTN